MVVAALPVRPVAVGIVLVGFFVWVAYLLRLGAGGAPGTLPANIKPYLTDEELEGRKVVQTGVVGLLTAVALAVGLSAYWLFLPSVQADWGERFQKESVARGARLFATTAQGGLNCAGCHGGGKGGRNDFVITVGPDKGKKVPWECPSLDDVYYRFTREEVKRIVTYGRPGSPMPAWGLKGGGGQTDQEIEDILNYLKFIEITPDEARKKAGADSQGNKITDGKTLFLKNCARCHTPRFSFTAAELRDSLPQGAGAYGPALTNEQNQFPDIQQHIDFIKNGSVADKQYGLRGIGNGRMPGFAKNPEAPLLDDDQVEALARFERSLNGEYGNPDSRVYATTETVTTTTKAGG